MKRLQTMEEKVCKTIDLIVEKGGIQTLRQAKDLVERYDLLNDLVPNFWTWDPISARYLVFRLYEMYKLDFGVCPEYLITQFGNQFCHATGDWVMCTCVIPQPFCGYRDKDEKPKYPDLNKVAILKSRQN